MSTDQTVFRVIFLQEDKVYEVYARYLSEESLMGFIEIEELLFTDAEEEKIKSEFQEVKRSYIPIHHVLRIDEVVKKGSAKVKQVEKKGNVHHLAKFRPTDTPKD
jgi:hypothetical protein